MWNSFIAWWNKDKIAAEAQRLDLDRRLSLLEPELQKTRAENEQLQQQLVEHSNELGVFRKQAEEDEARRNSKEPWVEIKSAEFNEVKGIQIELDWNEAFVYYLKDNGVKAKTDEGIVQKWLMMLYADLIDKFEQREIDNSDKSRVNDFL